jgi:putative transcriptional regulator
VTSTKARLLLATPELLDPNFHRSVVLVLEHNDDGALGLVLNRPRLVSGGDAVPQWADRLAFPSRLHSGGPVSEDSVIGLALGPAGGIDGLSPLLGQLGVVDLHRSPEELPDVEPVRLFAGYSGWSADQLEAELLAGGWMVVDALPEDALTPSPEELWQAVLGRQPGLLGHLAGYPDDPRLN